MNLFETSSYQTFLRQYIQKLPKRGRGEVNRIAGQLGVHASFVSQVLSGDKDFNLEQAHTLTKYLGLNALEADYFILQVQVARAGSHELREYWKTKLKETKSQSFEVGRRIPQDHTLTDTERAIFYSSWLYLAVWLFTSVGDGQTLETVVERFGITRARAREILDFLLTTQLCKLEGELYGMGPHRIHLENGSPFLSRHHINWRMKSLQHVERVGAQELMFTSPISISRADFLILREQLVEFIKQTSERVGRSEAEELACLNLDLFWVS